MIKCFPPNLSVIVGEQNFVEGIKFIAFKVLEYRSGS